MSPAAWSWVTAAVSISGLWVGGTNPRAGWIYSIANQSVWIAYGLATSQPGMIALSAAFIILNGRNLWRWKGTRFQPHTQGPIKADPEAGQMPQRRSRRWRRLQTRRQRRSAGRKMRTGE